MSKKYEHRIEILKDHKKDIGKSRHRTKTRKNLRNSSVSQQKKTYNDFRKKINKSKKIW